MTEAYSLVLPGLLDCGVRLMVNGEVNIDDIMTARPGGIIRIDRPESLRYIPASLDEYSRLAGMISDGL